MHRRAATANHMVRLPLPMGARAEPRRTLRVRAMLCAAYRKTLFLAAACVPC